jgi:hypothetical protein
MSNIHNFISNFGYSIHILQYPSRLVVINPLSPIRLIIALVVIILFTLLPVLLGPNPKCKIIAGTICFLFASYMSTLCFNYNRTTFDRETGKAVQLSLFGEYSVFWGGIHREAQLNGITGAYILKDYYGDKYMLDVAGKGQSVFTIAGYTSQKGKREAAQAINKFVDSKYDVTDFKRMTAF